MDEQRCIWCLRAPPEARFDLSHVLPEALGNSGQQVLPMGSVCSQCNQYFGTQLEPVLMDHPLVHLVAVLLRVIDPGDGLAFRDQFFDAAHPSLDPVNRSLHLDIVVSPNRLEVGVEVGIRGRIGRDLDARSLASLSRAVHKLAFENVAWSVFVQNLSGAPDLYSPAFDPVRQWARRGASLPGEAPALDGPATGLNRVRFADLALRGRLGCRPRPVRSALRRLTDIVPTECEDGPPTVDRTERSTAAHHF